MHEPSPTQKAYLARQKRDRRLVVNARLLVFLIFLAQWEILARAGWTDSFIFSSPSADLQNSAWRWPKPLAVHPLAPNFERNSS